MTPEQAIQNILVTPYRPGGNDLSGMDCWGLVEYWYQTLRGIILTDRCGIEGAESADFMEGYSNSRIWQPVEVPRVHDVAILPSVGPARQIIEHGHCGVVTWYGVLHISSTGGARLDEISAPTLKRARYIRYAGR